MRSNQKLKQRLRSTGLMAALEMVVTRPGEPSRAFAQRNEAADGKRVVTVITGC